MKKLILLCALSLSAFAGDLQLGWTGEPPFQVSAERVSVVKKACVITPVFDFKTDNNQERVDVNYTACTQFKVCNESDCAYLPRSTFAKGKRVICNQIVCK